MIFSVEVIFDQYREESEPLLNGKPFTIVRVNVLNGLTRYLVEKIKSEEMNMEKRMKFLRAMPNVVASQNVVLQINDLMGRQMKMDLEKASIEKANIYLPVVNQGAE